MVEYLKNNLGLKIKTDSGWEAFDGLLKHRSKSTIRLIFSNGEELVCTPDHEIYLENLEKKQAKDLVVGDSVKTNSAELVYLEEVIADKNQEVYDISNAGLNYRFFANGTLVSNCRFIIFEETLINSTKLSNLVGKDPIRKDGQVRWYKKISPDKSYVVGLDPAMGTGGNYAAIQVFELPTLEQVAEWQHNKSIVEDQIKTLQDILKYIDSEGATEIFWSVENNSLGEAALSVIRAVGEDSFPGSMLHDPVKTSAGRNFRKGFTTTNKSKIEACSKLKTWIESGKMIINSKNLISELKTFIAKSNSYEAKPGTTDDLVMATILTIRMINVVANWDDSILQAVSSNFENSGIYDDDEDYIAPLPVL